MHDTTFDLAIHLGPGVTAIAPTNPDDPNNLNGGGGGDENAHGMDPDGFHKSDFVMMAGIDDDVDPNKTETKFSVRLCIGMCMTVSD